MKKILFIIFLVSFVFAEDSVKTDLSCSQERYEKLKKEVAEKPDSAAIIFIWQMENSCPNLKKD